MCSGFADISFGSAPCVDKLGTLSFRRRD